MKIRYLIVLTLLYGYLMTSCNNSEQAKEATTEQVNEATTEQTKSEKTTFDANYCTVGNFLISPDEADEMIKHFKKMFNDKVPAGNDLVDSFWVDKCVINQFHEFLSKNSGYDGIRIYSVATTKKSNIWIVPTVDNINHDDAWGNILPAIPNCTNPEFKNYNKDEAIGKPLIDKFGTDFREEQRSGEVASARNDSLSRGVWFGKCMIDSLVKYLNNSALNLDGIKIHCGAYKTKNRTRGQKKDNQSTFIIVVSKSDGHGKHISDWDVLANIYRKDKKFFEGGYNHGQLCPTVCD